MYRKPYLSYFLPNWSIKIIENYQVFAQNHNLISVFIWLVKLFLYTILKLFLCFTHLDLLLSLLGGLNFLIFFTFLLFLALKLGPQDRLVAGYALVFHIAIGLLFQLWDNLNDIFARVVHRGRSLTSLTKVFGPKSLDSLVEFVYFVLFFFRNMWSNRLLHLERVNPPLELFQRKFFVFGIE